MTRGPVADRSSRRELPVVRPTPPDRLRRPPCSPSSPPSFAHRAGVRTGQPGVRLAGCARLHHRRAAVPRAATRRGRAQPHLDAAVTHPIPTLARPAARKTRRSHRSPPQRHLVTPALVLHLQTRERHRPRPEPRTAAVTSVDSARCLSGIVTHRRRLTAWRRHDLGVGVHSA